MADQQRDWWKDQHHDESTTRRSAPSDDSSPYNTDPTDGAPDDGGYNTSPNESPSQNNNEPNTGTGDNTPNSGEPTYEDTPDNYNDTNDPDTDSGDGYNTGPADDGYDTGYEPDGFAEPDSDDNSDLDEEPDDGDLDNDGELDNMENDDDSLDADDTDDSPDGDDLDSPDGGVDGGVPAYDPENDSEASSDDVDAGEAGGSDPSSMSSGDESDTDGSENRPSDPAVDDVSDDLANDGMSDAGMSASMPPPGASSMIAPNENDTYDPEGEGSDDDDPLSELSEEGDDGDSIGADESADGGTEPGFASELDNDDGGFAESSVMPDVDESAFSADVPSDGGGMGGGKAAAISGAMNTSGSASDKAMGAAEAVAKETVKAEITALVLANIWWILGIGLVVMILSTYLILGAVSAYRTMINEEDASGIVADGGSAEPLDYSNHNLSAEVLALEGTVSDELAAQGMDVQWTFIVLGMIQQESGGNVSSTPDVMQSSESQGWPMNTITDPATSIKYGVMALNNAVKTAETHSITDVRAILQGYNMNHAFINWLAKNGHNHWTSDVAEKYSMEKVYPAVTGSSSPATAANREQSMSPWAMSIGKPYYIRNGGDFHYPNAILHHLGIDYSGDGAIELSGMHNEMLTGGSLDGYVYPIPEGKYQITSNYGPRNMGSGFHKGIDLQYSGALFHQHGPLFAAADGKVIAAGFNASMGNYVKIDHGPPGDNDAGLDSDVSLTTTYMHLSVLPAVRAGMKVTAGQQIGQEGNTGNSFGDHLHFQLEQGGAHFDPRKVYKFPAPVM